MAGQRTIFAAIAALLVATAVPAQDSAPFLLLNQERLLTDSEVGQALLAEERAARDALRAEARDIEQRFEREERELTARRLEMEPEAFRDLADAFDARVVEARQLQEERSDALVAEFDRRRRQFYAEIAPVLVELLSRYGARAIFDEASVLIADQSLNITGAVIAEIDARAAEAASAENKGGPQALPEAEKEPANDE